MAVRTIVGETSAEGICKAASEGGIAMHDAMGRRQSAVQLAHHTDDAEDEIDVNESPP